MRCMWLVAVSLPMLVLGCAEPAPEPAPAPSAEPVLKREPVSCTIKGDLTRQVGSGSYLSVTLTNQTDADIYLAGNLDGSERKLRYPHCYFEVIRPTGELVDRPLGPRGCGGTNSLRAEDFVRVPPGGSFHPHQRIDDYGFFSSNQFDQDDFREPGVYRIRFVYSTKSDDIRDWHGCEADSAEVARLFKRVPKIEVRSDEFVLTVVPGK